MARFYAACVISAIALLHDEGFIMRNAIPYCICVTDAGYAQLADLTCSKKMDENKVGRSRSTDFVLVEPYSL